MYDDFAGYNLLGPDGDMNNLISLDQIQDGPIVKDIVTKDQFENDGPAWTLIRKYPDVVGIGSTIPSRMNFEKYQVLKGFEEHYKGRRFSAEKLKRRYPFFLERVMGPAAIRYIVYHMESFGTQIPFPSEQKQIKNSKELFSLNIYSFLKKKKMLSLYGVLQFAYSLQGYGSTAPDGTMSAFYLLVWITPGDFVTFMIDKLIEIIKDGLKKVHLKSGWLQDNVPVVSALSKGWGDVWKNMKDHFEKDKDRKVGINYNTKITKITRDGVV